MAGSQAVLRLHQDYSLGLAFPANVSYFGSIAVFKSPGATYTESQLWLLMVPSVLLLLLFPARWFYLRRADLKVLPNKRGFFKLVIAIAIAATQLAILVLGLVIRPRSDENTITANVVTFVASLTVCLLSFWEHGRSVKPSTLLTLYLVASIICDSINLASIYQGHAETRTLALLTASSGLKVILLILECLNKRSYLREPYKTLPLEQTIADLNRVFLFWMNGQIWQGHIKLLSVADLPTLDHDIKSRGLRTRMIEAWDKTAKPKPGSDSAMPLLKALFRCFGIDMLVLTIPRLLSTAFRYTQPILINRTIQYVTRQATESDGIRDDVTGTQIIFAAAIIYSGTTIFNCIYNQGAGRIMVQTRGALVGLIHARCLSIRDGVYDDAAAVTHMGNDVDGVDHISSIFQDALGNVIELIVGMIMLSSELAWWSLTPLVIVALSSQVSKSLGTNIGPRVMAWQAAKQKRTAITTSMVDYIKNIKMMGMATTVMSRIQDSRLSEIGKGNQFRWILVYFNSLAYSVLLFSPVLTLVFYAVDAKLRGQAAMDPARAFTAVAIISLVTSPANMLLSAFPRFGATIGTLHRIQNYLMEPSREDKRILVEPRNGETTENGAGSQDSSKNTNIAISFDNVSLKPAASAKTCLEDINIEIAQGSLNVVCGAVGTGKTTLARAMLGDVPPEKGTIIISTKRIGYCAQKPWLINASIKKIICGPIPDSDIDEEWYNTVVHVCGLVEDIEHFNKGDKATVGSRGVTLSGGQRQRVAIARAVYARPSILILDDVLSALDAKTEVHVAEQLLGRKGIFRSLGTTVILITHASQHLPLADHIIVLAESKIAEQGSWAQLRSSTGYVSELQVKESSGSSEQDAVIEKPTTVPGTSGPSDVELMDLTRRTGDISVYWYYLKSAGAPIVILFLALNLAFGFTSAASPYILRAWSESGGRDTWFYVSMYALSAVLGFFFIAGIIMSVFITLNSRAGIALHYKLLRTIMRAPLSYFSVTETGTTINRFTQDIGYIDGNLPFALLVVVLQLVRLLSQLILLFIMQVATLVCGPPLALALYIIQKFYLHTSRQLRFLDLESRAFVYSDFLETLEGISVIRAFGWEEESITQNLQHLDTSQTPHYIMTMIQLWLILVLDFLVAGIAIVVISLAVGLRSTTTGGQIGVSLNVVMLLNLAIVRLMEQWMQLETSMGAIARIKTLEETLAPEDLESENFEPPEEWPEKGAIEFRDVTAAYNPEAIALNGISLSISPGQKVGICGRTGSGKSTLLLSLLRLIEIDSGTIFIDGLDLTTISRETIRSRLIAIPQETFVLNDSIRLNIDPSGKATDEEIIAVLDKVQLWSVITSRGEDDDNNNNGNAEASTENPANGSDAAAAAAKKEVADPLEAPLKSSPFSHGQFQLFGLARALLLKSRSTILVLDEATSNVDAKTDALMQRIIRDEFSRHTILSIAHRLDTIRDSDVIVVLNKGKVVEFGAPDDLLAKTAKAAEGGEVDGDGKAWFKELWDGSH